MFHLKSYQKRNYPCYDRKDHQQSYRYEAFSTYIAVKAEKGLS